MRIGTHEGASPGIGPAHLPITPILYFGTSVVLLTTENEDASTNLAPMSSAWALGQVVVLGRLGEWVASLHDPRGVVALLIRELGDV